MFSASRARFTAAAEPALTVLPASNSPRRWLEMVGERFARGWMDWRRS